MKMERGIPFYRNQSDTLPTLIRHIAKSLNTGFYHYGGKNVGIEWNCATAKAQNARFYR